MKVRELLHELTADHVDLEAEVTVVAVGDGPHFGVTSVRTHHGRVDIECWDQVP